MDKDPNVFECHENKGRLLTPKEVEERIKNTPKIDVEALLEKGCVEANEFFRKLESRVSFLKTSETVKKFLKEDGSLDVDRINQLPPDQYIDVVKHLSQKQYAELSSSTPKCERIALVTIFGHDENGRIYPNIDMNIYNDKIKEIKTDIESTLPTERPNDKTTQYVQCFMDGWVIVKTSDFLPIKKIKVLSVIFRWTEYDTLNNLYIYHLYYTILDSDGNIVPFVQDFQVRIKQTDDDIFRFDFKFQFTNQDGELVTKERSFEESIRYLDSQISNQ